MLNKDRNKRVELFRTVKGSHNYNLNHAGSDRDWVVYYLPSLNDLLEGKMFAGEKSSDDGVNEYTLLDVRRLKKGLYNPSLFDLETLFSDFAEVTTTEPELQKRVNQLLELKEELSTNNLKSLFFSTLGMAKTSLGLGQREDREEKWRRKNLMHACRCLYFLQEFKKGDFKNFKQAVTYGKGERKKQVLSFFYHADFNTVLQFAEDKLQYTERNYKQYYMKNPGNAHEKVNKLVDELVLLGLDL